MKPINISLTFFYFLKKIKILCLILISTGAFAQATIETDRASAFYEIGETAVFTIQAQASGNFNYMLKYDNFTTPISSGSVQLNFGETFQIEHQENKPGVVIFSVEQNGNASNAAATFAPYQIEAFEDAPTDLDSFWNAQKTILTNIPMDPQITFHSNSTYSTTYRINLANIDNRRVYGYLSVPNGSGPFPAIITIPAFGDVPNLSVPEVELAERANMLSMSISIHNAEPDQIDPTAYEPDNYINPDEIYYKYAVLAGVRAVDYIFSRNDFDGNNIGFTGVSQGAGLSQVIAGVDERVNFLVYSNPILCQNTGLKHDRAGGFPNYIQRSRNDSGDPDHEALAAEASKYFDAIYFAKKFKGTSMILISYEDVVTPAATAFGAFNQLPGPKILVHSIDLGHEHPADYWNGRYDFFRRFVPGSLEPPFPWADTTKGYFIDAGDDISIGENEAANLTGWVEFNDMTNPNFDLKWEKISGPGDVVFSDTQFYNTTATFSSPGEYQLQFKADDFGQLNAEQKYFTLIDFVKITVGDTIIPPPSGCNSFENIALGKPTSQSSTQPNGESSNAADGNTSGDFWGDFSVSLTAWEKQPWWQIDLEEKTKIKEIKLWNRTDCCTEHFSNFYILVSDEPFDSDDLNETLNQPGVTAFFQEAVVEVPSTIAIDTSARYVRVQLEGQGFLGMAEIEIFGCVNTLLNQEIIFDEISNKMISDSSFEIQAVASSGLPVQFEILFGPASLDSNWVTLDGVAGIVKIRATQVGDSLYNPAPAVEQMFEVIDPNMPSCVESSNIALHQSASQSGTQVGANAGLAVDDNTNGNFWGSNSVTNSDWQENAWWQLDLDALAFIDSINIWNRTDCCSNFLSDFYVFVSDDPFASTDLQETINQFGVSSFFVEGVAGVPTSLPIGRTGQHIRIQLQGAAFVALAEVEVIGCFLQDGGSGGSEFFNQNEEKSHFGKIKIYPNPAKDFIKINLNSILGEAAQIQLLNNFGEILATQNFPKIQESEIQFSLKSFPAGIYFIKIKNRNHVETLPFAIFSF